MSKALVIKGANFAQNAIEQITVSDPIPCTGIALSQDAITLAQIGATATLTATLTPANTTEAVTWVSSDEDVVTVSEGAVTCVGVGTATVTAYCGTQSASCEVVCEVVVDANSAYSSLSNLLITTSNGRDYVSTTTSTRGSKIYIDPHNNLNGYRALFGRIEYDEWGIPIPKGTSHIKVDYPTQFNSYVQWVLMNSQLKQTYNSTDIARRMSDIQGFIPSQIGTFTIDLTQYEDVDYDSFLFDMRAKTDFDGATITGDVTITFS